ncbi:hypothetical protein FNAPI_6437 [Fusarium napiforme]|uniref:Uncharacterized protein n=1 Tax=Fusarium napiforme TaxID=42672 RepID=A0A8H5JJL6_9HYPO|nr:hypothetical protein FNAPI_6437 [Fusarium napiforme]
MLSGPEDAASSGLAHHGSCIYPDTTISTILKATATTTNQDHVSVAQEFSAMLYERRNGRAKLTEPQDKAIAVMV